jgi:hypothetical protein
MSVCALRAVQGSLQTPTTEEYAPVPPVGTMRAHVIEKGPRDVREPARGSQ